MSEMIVKTAVMCANASGVPEFLFAQVRVSDDEYSQGVHYEMLERYAKEQGYEPLHCFDEHDIRASDLRRLSEFFGQAKTQESVLCLPSVN